MIVIKKLERIASRIRFLLSHKNHKGLRFWHRRCHAAAEGRAASDAAAEGRAASDAAAGGRWGEQARVIAVKKLERVASEGKFLLSHKHH